MNKTLDSYRKRLGRLTKQSKEIGSPRTVTKRLLRNFSNKNVNERLKRCLFNFQILIQQLKQKYETDRKRDKIRMARNMSGPILKKYGLKQETFRLIGINVDKHNLRTKPCLTMRFQEKVQAFYLRDDNSRIITGMKRTVTKGKKKTQKRVLCDSLRNMHEKFLSEGDTKLSYTVFARLRPFWVLFPTEADRRTSLCKICDNMNLMVKALHKSGVLSSNNTEDLVRETVCNECSYKCMYGLYGTCRDRKVPVDEKALLKTVTWSQWKTKKEKRFLKDGKVKKEKVISFTMKETETDKANVLVDKFCEALDKFRKHTFNCCSQYKYFRQRRDEMNDTECIVHVDFSENAVCKMREEVQGMHFGASKKQITLHTGVKYMKDKIETFCIVSDSLDHDAGAIWAHLKPTLTKLREDHSNVKHIEVFSDGPVMQYRQKSNFYLLSTEISKLGFKTAKWSFFETSHGMGVPDAIGGSLKRTANSKVRYGEDIPDASVFVQKLQNSKVDVSLVTEKEILDQKKKLLNKELNHIPGPFQIHQVIVQPPRKILYRNLSCECIHEKCNSCFVHLRPFDLLGEKGRNKRRRCSDTEIKETKKQKFSSGKK